MRALYESGTKGLTSLPGGASLGSMVARRQAVAIRGESVAQSHGWLYTPGVFIGFLVGA